MAPLGVYGRLSASSSSPTTSSRKDSPSTDLAGLIKRRPDPNDRRGTLVRLTRRGGNVIDQAVETHVGNEERLLGVLTAAERRTLDRVLKAC